MFSRDFELNGVCKEVCVEETFTCITNCDTTDSECITTCLRAETTCVDRKYKILTYKVPNKVYFRMPVWCWLLFWMPRMWQPNLRMFGKLWNVLPTDIDLWLIKYGLYHRINLFQGCNSKRKLEQLSGHKWPKPCTLYLQLQRWRIMWNWLCWTIQSEN